MNYDDHLAKISRKGEDIVPRTAGLGMEVSVGEEVHLKAGLWVSAGAVSYLYGRFYPWRPIGAQWDLGAIRADDGTAVKLLEETSDWAHARLVLGSSDSAVVQVTLSRLTPAALLEMDASSLRLDWPQESLMSAVKSENAVAVERFGQKSVTCGESGWVVLFWSEPCKLTWPEGGIRQHISLSGARGRELLERTRYRTPMLVVFSRSATLERAEGGIKFDLGAPGGKMVIMPLYGAEDPAGEHEIGKWAEGLPQDVIARCNWWAERLSRFPVTAQETYKYDAAEDKVTVSQRVEYVTVRAGGISCVPVSPIVALARTAGLPITFDKEPTDASYRSAYGPYWVVDGVESSSWSVKGLAKYINDRPEIGPSTAGSKPLETELAAEVDKMLAEPCLAPWIYETRRFGPMGNVYWRMPSETAYFLAQAMPVLGSEQQEKVRVYLRQYYQRFPFLETAALSTRQGSRRERYDPGRDAYYMKNGAPDKVTFAAVRGLADYYGAIDEKPTVEVWDKVQSLLVESLKGSEWATGGWCLDQTPEPIPPSRRVWALDIDLPTKIANSHLSGLIGMLRMARECGQEGSGAATLAWGRLAREFAYRLALAKYPYWLCPPDGPMPFAPDWTAHSGVNEVRFMNQFEVNCLDHTQDWCWSLYVAYLEMTPEVGYFLRDYAKDKSVVFLEAVDRAWPLWWLANMTSEIGNDSSAGLIQPVNTYSLYMANAWIKGEDGPKLVKRTDVSWTARGDLFYMHKLAEAIKALRPAAQQSAQ